MDVTRFDHVVVGAGIMGAAAAYHLSCRAGAVLLLEQSNIAHAQGSSHGNSRIFRLAYDKPVYVRLARRALAAWSVLEDAARVPLLVRTGAVDVGPPSALEGIRRALALAGVETSGAVPEAGADQFSMPANYEVLYQPQGGSTWAARTLAVLLDLAVKRGAIVQAGARVEWLETDGDAVCMGTTAGLREAGSVVVTAGGWSNHLLDPLGLSVPLRVTREHVAYYRRRAGSPFLPFIWRPGGGQPEVYGLPNLEDETVKVGFHIAGREVVAGDEAVVSAEEVERITGFVRRNLPSVEPEPVLAETCLYASTPDDDFVIDRVGRVTIGAGFGGHGFKFAPLIGAMLADLAQGGHAREERIFSRGRFEAARA